MDTKIHDKTHSKTKTKTTSMFHSKTKTKAHIKTKTLSGTTKGTISDKKINDNIKPIDELDILNNSNTTQIDINSNNNGFEIEQFTGPISIRNTKKRFHTRPKTAYHIDRKSLVDDEFIELLDDYYILLRKKKTLKGKQLNNLLYNDDEKKCICKNLNKKTTDDKKQDSKNNYDDNEDNIDKDSLDNNCKCDNLVITKKSKLPFTFSKKYIIQCKNNKSTTKSGIKSASNLLRKDLYLKTELVFTNTIKFINKIGDNIFIRLNKSAHEIICNRYLQNSLPYNVLNVLNTGKCNRNQYILYNEGNLESFESFLGKLLKRELDDEFEIYNSDDLYKIIVNLLLQTILIYGHLNTSNLNFNNTDYIPQNLMIKRVPVSTIKKFNYKIILNSGTKFIKVKNMGFAVILSNVQNSIISLNSTKYGKYILLPSSSSINPNKYKEIHNNDIQLYKFFNELLSIKIDSDNKKIDLKKYFQEKKLDKTILGFINNNTILEKIGTISFKNLDSLLKKDKNKKQMQCQIKSITGNYIKILDLLNYHLFP